MKKTYLLLNFALLLGVAACSLIPTVNPTAAPLIEATSVPTDAPTASHTPIALTLTFTLTPTLAGQMTRTPTPTIESTPTRETATQAILITPNTPTQIVGIKGFVSINVSGSEFYKTADCQPTSVKFTAQVADPANAAFVLLSVRFKSKQTGTTSKWTSITMQSARAGTYTYDLFSEMMKGVDLFENAWVQYQFVVTDSNSHEIGRTDVFSERLTLLECESTPEPSATVTPLKP